MVITLDVTLLTADQLKGARATLAGAVSVAAQLDAPAVGRVATVARQGFVDGAATGLLVAVAVAALGALIAWRFLPARSPVRPAGELDASAAFAHSDVRLRPIGWVDSPLSDPARAPRQGDEGAPDASLHINPDVAVGLRDLQPGAEILLLTWLDRAQRDLLEVHPQGSPANPILGVFSTRSPNRPNPIGLHPVRVRAITGTCIRVGPLEAVDGTPVLDIKPDLASSPARLDGVRSRPPNTANATSVSNRRASRTVHPELSVLPVWPPRTIATLSTVDEGPHTIPISAPVRAGDRCILFTLNLTRGSLARLREQSLVALTVITEGNIAFTARGPARIIQEPMTEAPDYAAVALDVDHIDDHRQAEFLVERGIDRRWVDQDDQRRLSERVRALASTTT